MIIALFEILWFFLPAGAANAAPVVFKRVPFLDFPVDFNKTLFGKRIFGSHKTFRGFFFGVLVAVAVVFLQQAVEVNSLVDYSAVNPLFLGFLLGFGALFGDLAKSFFKRQFSILPGRSFVPFDQIDWVLGSALFSFWYVKISFFQFVAAVVLLGILHMLVNLFGYAIGIKTNKL
jgi:CDP-2,3-bis-(O-geranylgeranyl)-sn-glycerol synthase